MRKRILNNIWGTPFALVVFVVAIILPSIVVLMPVQAAGSTYSWNDGIHIQENGGTNLLFTQVTSDDLGTPLAGSSSPSGSEMVLESQPTNDPDTSCNPNNIGGFGNGVVNDPALFVNDGPGGSPAQDAYFGKGELLVVQNYLNATRAQLVTFTDLSNGCHANAPTTISLSGKPNYGQWQSATANGQTQIQIKNITTGDVFTEVSIDNGTMTLSGPDKAPNGRPCRPQTITIGDENNSFITAHQGTLTVTSLQGNNPSAGGGTCQPESSLITMINQYQGQGVETTGRWNGTQDPSGQITITGISAADKGWVTTGQIFAEPQCGGDCNGFPSPINPNTNTMTLNGGIITADACKANKKEDVMTISPYKTAQTATAVVYGSFKSSSLAQPTCAKRTITVTITDGYAGSTPIGSGNSNSPRNSNGCIIPGNNGLNWLLCPLFDLISGWVTSVNNTIASLLAFNVNQYFTEDMQFAFNAFRNLSIGLLVIAGLAMVISQAADLEIFNAYTVRKALPRLVVAAIAISLAWPLLKFTVGFFNDLGQWIGQIIIQSVTRTPLNGDVWGWMGSTVGDAALASLGVLAAFTFLGPLAIFSLLLSAGLLMVVALFILTIRQIIIMICILLAPLAIASFVLPGTERLGRFYRETLIATLLMYPIIMAFLAAGASMAYITLQVQSGNYWYHILAIIFYIAPYVMLPFAFRIAGGLMAQITNWAQGTHHQTIESRLQAYRQGERQYLHQQRMEGRRGFLLPTALGGDKLNSLYRRAATRGGISIIPADWRRYGATERKRIAQTAAKTVQEGGDIAGDDFANGLALKQGVTAGSFLQDYAAEQIRNGATQAEANQRAHRALGAIEANYGQIGSRNATVAAFMAKAQSGTGYVGSDRGLAELTDDARHMLTSGLMNESDVIQAIKSNKARVDQSGISWTNWQAALRDRGTDNFYDKTAANGVNAVRMDRVNTMRDSMLDGSQLGDLTRGRPEAAQAMAPRLQQRVENAAANLRDASGTALEESRLKEFIQSLADAASVHDYLAASSPQIGNEFATKTFGTVLQLPDYTMPNPVGLPPGTPAPVRQAAREITVEEAIELFRGSSWMRERRREWATPPQGQQQNLPGSFGGPGNPGSVGGNPGNGGPLP